MQNKSVEERAMKLYPYPSNATLGPIHRNKLKMKIDNYRAAYIKGRQEEAARQDQGVVGTQGRESFIHKVLEEFPPMGSKYEAADFMRAHWPVSEGEGMRPVEPAADLPDIHVGDMPENPAPVDSVALLEWVGIERWQLLNAVYHATGEAVWHNNKTNRKVNTAALIQEFINQKTKEV